MKLLSASELTPALRYESSSPNPPLATHLWLPLAITLILSAWLMGGGGDQWIADAVYHAQGSHWQLRSAWFTGGLIHRGGKWLSALAALWAIGAAIAAWRSKGGSRSSQRWPLTMLAASVVLSTALVSRLKHLTGMDCPWDLSRYGGHQPYYGLFESRQGLTASGCFPAGHASAGYAWLALYFFAIAVKPQWRLPALALGLAAGLVFGVAQQLRGAHFVSHDLWTMMICWTVPLLLFRMMPLANPVEARA